MVEITVTPGQSLPSGYAPITAWKTNLENSLKLQEEKSHKFNSDPYVLKEIRVKATTIFPSANTKPDAPRAGFCFVDATLKNKAGEIIPTGGMLRGNSVVMMVSIARSASLKPNLTQDPRSWSSRMMPKARMNSTSS